MGSPNRTLPNVKVSPTGNPPGTMSRLRNAFEKPACASRTVAGYQKACYGGGAACCTGLGLRYEDGERVVTQAPSIPVCRIHSVQNLPGSPQGNCDSRHFTPWSNARLFPLPRIAPNSRWIHLQFPVLRHDDFPSRLRRTKSVYAAVATVVRQRRVPVPKGFRFGFTTGVSRVRLSFLRRIALPEAGSQGWVRPVSHPHLI